MNEMQSARGCPPEDGRGGRAGRPAFRERAKADGIEQYPGVAGHRDEHQMVTEFIARQENGETTMCARFHLLMRDWHTRHK